ncbi:hypothetical protein KFK09_010121 [Dendrobium nobile]|uniref:Uncharacterized protein n=1 Tax=Dendrobium nobile TaxID=94219 RepID=A0A8T3BIY4_DENNO|nr:hypothetical protein KFK09_010121 [Dendrobium nobile]
MNFPLTLRNAFLTQQAQFIPPHQPSNYNSTNNIPIYFIITLNMWAPKICPRPPRRALLFVFMFGEGVLTE